jgi:hypothetical protein
MLALKVRRHLESAWWKLDVTVEEGLQELEELLRHGTGASAKWQCRDPSSAPTQRPTAATLRRSEINAAYNGPQRQP